MKEKMNSRASRHASFRSTPSLVSPPEARRRQLSRPEPGGTQAPFSGLQPTFSRNRPSASARIQARGEGTWIGSKLPSRCNVAGLAAAALMRSARLEALLIEARDRPGGRACTDLVMPHAPFDRRACCIHGQSLAGRRLRHRRAAIARSATAAVDDGRRRRSPISGSAMSPSSSSRSPPWTMSTSTFSRAKSCRSSGPRVAARLRCCARSRGWTCRQPAAFTRLGATFHSAGSGTRLQHRVPVLRAVHQSHHQGQRRIRAGLGQQAAPQSTSGCTSP